MSTGVGYQVSPKIGSALVNIQGDSPEEFEQALEWFTENAQKVAEAVVTLEAAYNAVNGGLTPQPAAQAAPRQRQYNQNRQAPAESGPPAPSCQHGAMEFKSGGGGSSGKKPWSGWFCRAGRDSGCAVQWA